LRCNVIPAVRERTTDGGQIHFAIVAKGSDVAEIIVVKIYCKIIAGGGLSGIAALNIHKMLRFQNLLC
jgi:hypothetical protein